MQQHEQRCNGGKAALGVLQYRDGKKVIDLASTMVARSGGAAQSFAGLGSTDDGEEAAKSGFSWQYDGAERVSESVQVPALQLEGWAVERAAERVMKTPAQLSEIRQWAQQWLRGDKSFPQGDDQITALERLGPRLTTQQIRRAFSMYTAQARQQCNPRDDGGGDERGTCEDASKDAAGSARAAGAAGRHVGAAQRSATARGRTSKLQRSAVALG